MSKITDYGALAAASVQPDDVLPIVDVHDFTQAGTGTTKKITVANLLQQVFVTEYGADPTGVADSTTAFTSAIAAVQGAGGGTVRVPAGTYTCNTAQIPAATGLHLVGDGYECTKINATAGGAYLFNLDPPGYSTTVHVEDLLITGLTLNVTGMDIFWGANIVRSKIIGNCLIQNSAGNAVMNVTTSTGSNGATYIAECEFSNKELIGGTPRTIEAWHLDHSGTGLSCNDNVWHGGGSKIWPSNSGDTAKYWFYLIGGPSGATGSRHNTWRDLIFELPNGTGGLIHLQNATQPSILNVSSEDLSSNTVGNPLILLDTNGSPGGCSGVAVRNYSRRGGSNVSNTNPDIKLDANAGQVTIESPSTASGGTALTIDYGSAAGPVTEIGFPATVTRLNAPSLANLGGINMAAWADPATPVPSDLGYVGWAYDPAPMAGTSGVALGGSGTVQLIRVPVRTAQSITTVRVDIITAGSGLTAGQCFAGVYLSSNALLATTADQSTAWASTGTIDMTLTGGPFTVTAPYVYVALLANWTTSSPQFWSNQARTNGMANGKLASGKQRFATANTAQTSLPASLSGFGNTSAQIWAAVW